MTGNPPSPVLEYLQALKNSDRLGSLVVHHEVKEAVDARFAGLRKPLPASVERILELSGIPALYSHQVEAIDLLRAGRNVAVTAPTAGGKTLIYTIPVLESAITDPDAKALYLFPLKALARDQLRVFQEFASFLRPEERPQAAVYDGDTSAHHRKKIRDNPPQALLTNPEMLHLSLLAHHDSWAAFWAGLSLVVVDEAHTYRGVLGSHMAQLFRRLRRVCRRFGSDPRFAFLSATVGNPVELAEQLSGEVVAGVDKSGSPSGKRHFLFVNPALTMAESPSQTAILLLKAALARGLRTIVYAQSRKMTELIAMWAEQRSGPYAGRISAYRAGFLPEERRDIEAKMASGELLAVVSTSALELGIDIGGLDLCILVGYPGSVMSTLQRGGRVGRGGRESAVVLVAGEDALDQYFMRRPTDFFSRPPEEAKLNPSNPVILEKHLECAAAELPLVVGEPWLLDDEVRAAARRLELSGRLMLDADGKRLHGKRKRPHRDVSLRGVGGNLRIVEGKSAQDEKAAIGFIDEHRAYKEAHPGAVYLHRGSSYLITDLDLAAKTVRATKAKVEYFTRPRGEKATEILSVTGSGAAWGTRVHKGRLRVTETITGYERRRTRGQTLITVVPLELPPLTFETDGLWFEIPRDVQRTAEDDLVHFMGGIHAMEHAAIGIMPLLIMTDRNDLGGISTPHHPQVESAAVFIYDGAPGGVGLADQAFEKAEELLERTLCAVAECGCETGCPSCVHSPKCGSGNRPIDKAASLYVLNKIKAGEAPRIQSMPEQPAEPAIVASTPGEGDELRCAKTVERFAVLDVETRLSAAEVGGWGKAHRMGVSAAVVYDSTSDSMTAYTQDDMEAMFEQLAAQQLVIGFNIKRFDYLVLSGVCGADWSALPTLDMLEAVHKRLGYRLSLDGLASATLGVGKSADGLQALQWWKEGRLDEIIEYCKRDVAVTRDLYLFGRDNGYLLFTNKAGKTVRLPVEW